MREFRSLVDANQQLVEWVYAEAGQRCQGTTREQPLAPFLGTERALRQPLPALPPVRAVWAKVKVHRDAHVQFARCLYSVPVRLVGQTLWFKASDTLIRLDQDHEPVAGHPRQTRPGARVTVPDPLPPEALAWSRHDTPWCLREAARIGPGGHALVHTRFADRVLVNLRAAQGILRLEQPYGAARLEVACTRALAAGSARYRTVKTILAKNLDQPLAPAVTPPLPATDTQGGRFCRDAHPPLH